MRAITILFFLSSMTMALFAQETGKDSFRDLWRQYEEGKDVGAALSTLSENPQYSKRQRFNAVYLLAISQLAKGDNKLAMASLIKADALVGGTVQVAIRRAEVLFAQKDFKTSNKLLQMAKFKVSGKKKSALYARHQILLARISGEKKSFKKAVKILNKLKKSQSKNWEVFFFLGRFYEAMDLPKETLAAYEKTLGLLPKKDPCLGIYALQRWAALSISSNSGSYGQPKVIAKAKERYLAFLKRAPANGVSSKLIARTKSAVSALNYFSKKK